MNDKSIINLINLLRQIVRDDSFDVLPEHLQDAITYAICNDGETKC